MSDFNPEDLTKERNLFDIYRQLRLMQAGFFNNLCTFLVCVLLILYSFYTSESSHELADKVRSLSEFGLNFAASILGFLIAGFTIFFTISKTDLFLALAKTEHRASKLSWLKYSFFAFMEIFIIYIAFLFLCVLVKIFAAPHGVITIFLSNFPNQIEKTKKIIASIGMIVIGTWFVYLIIVLKSFIFNVYHIAMTSIRWEWETENKKPHG